MAVRIEGCADNGSGADDPADLRQKVALAIVEALGDHGPVQAQQHAIHRQGVAQLADDFVAQVNIGPATDDSAGFCPGGRSLDHLDLVGRSVAEFAQRHERGTAQ